MLSLFIFLEFSLKYIAGVSEKTIANEPQHWDLLCDLDEGTVQWNESTVDSTFIAEAKSKEPFFTEVRYSLFFFL